MRLDPFYLIVDSADWIARLVPLGVKLVQLRVKDRSEAYLRQEIRSARAICAEHRCQLVVNDYWQLAIEEGCDFIHLGQEDLNVADLAAIRSAGLKLGLSTHDDAELDTALSAGPDYIALGPIYRTVLKEMIWSPQGPELLSYWKKRVGNLPLVAIGGLTPERAVGMFEYGADSAAVVTDVLASPSPEARVKEWILTTNPYRPRINLGTATE